jgi:YgiT-type zinc finger domain-containing protein
MRDRKWIDCPCCGAKDSMRVCRNVVERIQLRGYSPIVVEGLDGQFCTRCGDGFWSLRSERKIERLLAEHVKSSQRVS